MSIADQLAEQIFPWWTQDFEDLVRAIGSMWEHSELYCLSRDDGTPAWAAMFDPAAAPTEALPYLAQWVGEMLRTGLTDPQMRQWIVDRPNSRRGTPKSIGLAAQRSLVGARSVRVFERTNGDGTADPTGDNFVVYTFTSDTPDPEQVWQDLLSVTFADMTCHYTVLTASSWASIEAGHSTWAAVWSAFPTWSQVRGGAGGGMAWNQ